MSAGEIEQLSLEGFVSEESPAAEPEPTKPAAPAPHDDSLSDESPFPPTAEQAAAIDARDRDVFLEAGAGTGKTRVLVDRYCDAVDLDGAEPERILAFTFTEKAAAEMRRRVRVELARRARNSEDPERRARLTKASRAGEGAPITTIHGFCRRLLASHPVAAGLDPHFRVLDAEEATRLAGVAFDRALDGLAASDPDVARVAAGYRLRLGGMIRAAHDDLRNHGQRSPALPPLQITAFDGSDQPPDPAEIESAAAAYEAIRSLLVAFAAAYEEVKADRSGADFDDLQLLALELLRESPAVGAAYAARFDHLLVDEFQDTSPLQVGLIAALRGPGTRLFTVGDEFQSIYAFRGADLASFRAERARIRAEQGEDAVLPLSGSFRSTAEIVAAVNAIGGCLLEGFQPLRVGKLPSGPVPGPPGPSLELLLTEREGWTQTGIELPTAASETAPNRIAEARRLALRLRELADGGVDPGSMVLLLRAFSHVDAYAEALELAGLDPYVVGGRGYWSAQQVEDALRLLSCVANPLEDEALFGALASPACGASPDALWILRRIAGKRRHIWPAIREHLLEPEDPGGGPDQSGDREAERRPDEGEPVPDEDEAEPDREPEPDREAEPEPDEDELERRRQAAEWAGRIPAADRERIGLFATRLRELRARAALLPLDELVERTLETFDYDLAALAMPGGRRRAANLLKLIRIAGEYESHEGRDLRGFLAYARDRAALSDREAEAAIAAEEHPGVTVMTIHAAKGLEFDCVAVADLGRGLASPGAPPELRLDFGAEGAPEHEDEGQGASGPGTRDPERGSEGGPRVGLRLARAGAGSLSLDGYRDLNDAAARSEAQESGRLAYVAASRARERLILSGLFDPIDVEGGRPEPKPSHSALAHLLPRLGVGEEPDQLLAIPPAEPRTDLEASFEAPEIAVSLHRADPESAAELRFDRRPDLPEPPIEGGGRPPLLALSERGGSAARSLSYAALAEYRRCGYRFLTERVLGLGGEGRASSPLEPDPSEAGGRPAREHDEEPVGPGTGTPGTSEVPEALVTPGPPQRGGNRAAGAAARSARLGFGRAVHGLLEWSARNGWARPDAQRLAATLAAEGAGPAAAAAAGELVSGWLDSPLLAELRAAGASFRPEVAFRTRLGDTVLRGSIDLLATVPGEPPLVIDYKTDSLVAGGEAALDEAYALQRSLYALAVSDATGADRIASAYVFLQQPDRPLRTVLGGEEIAAGRDSIAALVERIRSRDFEATDHPHAALCHDCPARARLCPHPPERTLARP